MTLSAVPADTDRLPTGLEPVRDADPYVLHGRPLRDGINLEATSRFSEPVWRLEPALLQAQLSARRLDFTTVPAPYRPAIKVMFYTMLSGELPAGENRAAVNTLVSRLSQLRRFLQWLEPRTTALAQVTANDLQAYAAHLRTVFTAPASRQSSRSEVRLLWRYSAQLPGGGLPLDPSRLSGWGEPHRTSAPENATDRIPEAVLGPLLGWALRFVDDFAPDILAANDRRLAMRVPLPRHRRGLSIAPRLDALVTDYRRRGKALPGHQGRLNIAFLAAELRCSRDVLQTVPAQLQAAVDELEIDHATFDAPITAQLDGQPWTPGINSSHELEFGLGRLMLHLQVACYITVAFLSGMRDAELKHLRRGSLRVERDPDGVPYRWTVSSRAFKGEVDADGVEATWTIGEPGARAIAILELLQPPDEDWLFAVLPVGPGCGPKAVATNTMLSISSTINQLNAFTSWINTYCASRGRTDAILQADGQPWRLTTQQFRRTLAWFIARRPGGSIAGAIAYRHHSIHMFEGYAGTSDSGFRAEVEAEQALMRGETLLAMADRHEHNHLTGPAAQEAGRRLDALARESRYAGAVITDPRRLKRLMERHDPAVYPGDYVTCVFNPAKALCMSRQITTDQPSLPNCRPHECANVALTEDNRHAWNLEIDEADRALENAETLPPLLAGRIRTRRDSLVRFAERHGTDPGQPS